MKKLIGEIKTKLQTLREETQDEIDLRIRRRSMLMAIDHIGRILNNLEDDFLYFSKTEKGKT